MNNDSTKGIWYSITAYALWGILPFYWKLLSGIRSEEILSHRIIWSFLLVIAILLLTGRGNSLVKVLSNRKTLLVMFVAALLISVNWYTFIWAVNHAQVVQASLGYYINPLISVTLGMTVLRERMNVSQWFAVILAAIGIGVITVEYGTIPWIALILAFSFAFYGLVKKMAPVEAMIGLAYETAILAPVAFLYVLFLGWKGAGSFGHVSFATTFYLIMAGVATTLPLFWFAKGAQRIPLSMLAFIQFLSPTISLLIGIFAFHETFTKVHLISFSLIWSAILLYTLSQMKWIIPKKVLPKKELSDKV